MTGIRIVVPFRPFAPESDLHRTLRDFDWLAALRMVVHSAVEACQCPVHAVTDRDTDLPVPALQYVTRERRLMLWVLEACAAFLSSEAFDRDTIALDVDQIVTRDLAPLMPPDADLGLLIRPQPKPNGGERLLNGVQFWSVRAKDRLAGFYRSVLDRACRLSDDEIRWGADTIALRQLVEPLAIGTQLRAGLRVAFIEEFRVLEAFSSEQMFRLKRGDAWPTTRPVIDFRYKRKGAMRPVFESIFGVQACKW